MLLVLAVTMTASAPLLGLKSTVAMMGLNRGREEPDGLSASKLNSRIESSGLGSAELSKRGFVHPDVAVKPCA